MSLYYANGPDGSRASKSRWGALRRAMRSRMGSASMWGMNAKWASSLILKLIDHSRSRKIRLGCVEFSDKLLKVEFLSNASITAPAPRRRSCKDSGAL